MKYKEDAIQKLRDIYNGMKEHEIHETYVPALPEGVALGEINDYYC